MCVSGSQVSELTKAYSEADAQARVYIEENKRIQRELEQLKVRVQEHAFQVYGDCAVQMYGDCAILTLGARVPGGAQEG
eukprot:684213-Rhodomonas_salina.2